MLSRRKFLALAAGAPLLPLACSSNPDDVTIQASGATFPAPLYKRWFLETYRHGITLGSEVVAEPYRVRINYQPIGSGAGTRQFREGLTQFGASDDAKADDLAQIKKERDVEAMALPMTAGTIVLACNVPPLREAGRVLLLTRENLIDVLVGEITDWSDDRLIEHNKALRGYQKPIIWVRRSEGSGTSAAFTRHLAAVDPERWPKSRTGKSPDWPVPGVGAKGNDGVSAIIGQTPGALGYVEYGYAQLSKLPFAAVQNKHGEFAQPKRVVDPKDAKEEGGGVKLDGDQTPDQIALASAKMRPDFLLSAADPPAKNAYPIATYTWMLVQKTYRDEKIARTMGNVLEWCLTAGQEHSEKLDYVPMPQAIAKAVIARVREVFPRA